MSGYRLHDVGSIFRECITVYLLSAYIYSSSSIHFWLLLRTHTRLDGHLVLPGMSAPMFRAVKELEQLSNNISLKTLIVGPTVLNFLGC